MKKMNSFIAVISLVFTLVFSSCDSNDDQTYDPPVSDNPDEDIENVEFYLTTPDQNNLVRLQESGLQSVTENDNFSINIDESESYQSMDGFGFTLTG